MAGEGFQRFANGTRCAADLCLNFGPVWELLPSCCDLKILISCCLAIAAVCCSWFFGSCVAGFLRLANGTRYAADLCFNFIRSIANLADQISQKVRDQLLECKRRLASIVRSRLMAAVDKRDHPTIVRLVRVFRMLDLEEEGLQIFVAYLRTVIALGSRDEFERLKEIAEQGDADFVTCLTNLFNDIVLAVQKNDKVLRSLCGKDGIVYAIYDLQKECDYWGTQVLNEYMDYRKLSRLASEIDSYSMNLTEGPDPIEVGKCIEEILSLTQLGEDYTEFMVSKIRAVYPELAPRATKAFRSGTFNTVVQDLTGFYDSAARFIQTLLQIDARFRDSGSDQREQLLECKRRLESIVRSRLAAAVGKRDHHTILRFVLMFPPLGLEEEGLQIFVAYLRTVIALRSRDEFEQLRKIAEQGGADFVTCLTNLFDYIVLAVEENDKVLRSLCGKDGIVYAIYDLQKEWNSRGTQVLKEYMDYLDRKLLRMASEINSDSRNLTEGPDPIEVKKYIEEILSLTQLGERYTELMVSKIRAVYPDFAPQATEAFRSGSFNTVVHDQTDFYDSAARFIQTFLQIDARFRDSGSDQREQLLECKRRLESIVRSKLADAVDRWDHSTILRFVRVFPLLGLEEEGLQIYVAYLRKVIALRSRLEFEHLTEVAEQGSHIASNLGQGGADFVTCLTNLFKDIVLAVEENDEVLRSLCGEDGIVYAICELQEECDSRGTQILKKYMDYRKLSRLASVRSTEGPDPIEVEKYIEEILSLTRRGEDYTEFMVSKIRAVYPEFAPRATEAFRSGSFNKVVQRQITKVYVNYEKYFMVKNVRKAIKMNHHLDNSLITSMVGEVFYVLKISCMRSISTGSSNLVIAVLTRAINLLAKKYSRALARKMRTQIGGPGILSQFLFGEREITAIDFSAFNNVDISADYVLRLRQEIKEQCAEVFPAPADREKVNSCLSELGEISSFYKRGLSLTLELVMLRLSPNIRPVLESLEEVSYELSDAEYEDNEVNDPWVQNLLHAIETDIAWLQPLMTLNNYDSVVQLVIDFTVVMLEEIMMLKRFNELGGLQLDREVRALVNYFSEMSQRPVRDKFARLSQMTTILNFERVSEILDFWGENARPMTWLLEPADVRRVLGLRIDFDPEAIAALRL